MAEDTEFAEQGSPEWREKVQALILAPSPFDWRRVYDEEGSVYFEVDIGTWNFSIVPEWDERERCFNNYMFDETSELQDEYEGPIHWDSLMEAQRAVEERMSYLLTLYVSDAFVSFSEGLTLLYECSKKHRDFKPEGE